MGNEKFDGERFVEKLKEVSGGKKQDEIAKDIGVSKDTITNWKKKNTFPQLDTLLEIHQQYGCSIDYLLGTETEQATYTMDFWNIMKAIMMFNINSCDYFNMELKGNDKNIGIIIKNRFGEKMPELEQLFKSYNALLTIKDSFSDQNIIDTINSFIKTAMNTNDSFLIREHTEFYADPEFYLQRLEEDT